MEECSAKQASMFNIQRGSCCQLLLPDDNNMKLRAAISIAGCGIKVIPAVSMKFQWQGERCRGETAARWAARQQQVLLLNSRLDILLQSSPSSRNLSGTNRRFPQIISQATKSKQLHSSQKSETHLSQLRIWRVFCFFFVKKKLQLKLQKSTIFKHSGFKSQLFP